MLPPNGLGLNQRQRPGSCPAVAPIKKSHDPRRKRGVSRRITPLKRGKTAALPGRAADTNRPNLAHNPPGIEQTVLAQTSAGKAKRKNASFRRAPNQFEGGTEVTS